MQGFDQLASRPFTLGLTGGIACGKSTVSNLFSNLGAEVVDADQIARDLFKVGSPHLEKLRQKFGSNIFKSTGELDRAALRNIVFNNSEALRWLNDFTHPLVYKEMLNQLVASQAPYVILDIPLLVNDKGEISPRFKPIIDRILVVDCSPETQLSRLQAKRGLSKEEGQKILHRQAVREDRVKHADDLLVNEGSLSALEKQVFKLHNKYMSYSRHEQ
jgi:dephospho-CoA kinase